MTTETTTPEATTTNNTMRLVIVAALVVGAFFGAYRIAHWDKFGAPAINPQYGFDLTGLWWSKEKK